MWSVKQILRTPEHAWIFRFCLQAPHKDHHVKNHISSTCCLNQNLGFLKIWKAPVRTGEKKADQAKSRMSLESSCSASLAQQRKRDQWRTQYRDDLGRFAEMQPEDSVFVRNVRIPAITFLLRCWRLVSQLRLHHSTPPWCSINSAGIAICQVQPFLAWRQFAVLGGTGPVSLPPFGTLLVPEPSLFWGTPKRGGPQPVRA